MAITFTQLAADPDTANTTSYATPSISPTANRVLVAVVHSSRGSSLDPDTPSLSGNGLTWDHAEDPDDATVADNLFVNSGTIRHRICVFVAATGASPSSGAVTATFANACTGCTIIVAESNADIALTDFVRQVKLSSGTGATSASVTLGAFEDANNATFSCFGLNGDPGGITHEGNEIADVSYATPATRTQAQYLDNDDTSPGVTWSGANSFGGIGIEFGLAGAVAYELNVEPGSYAVTGAAATPLADRTVNAAAGSYALSGVSASAVAGYVVSALPGSYTLTGADAELEYTPVAGDFEINAEPGAYSVTGAEASPVAARMVSALPGTYAVTGSQAGVLAGRTVNTEAGSYALTGAQTTFQNSYALVATAGSYLLTGAQAGLEANLEGAVVTLHFDQPSPSGGIDEGTPAAGHYDQPTPGTVLA